MQVGKSGPCKNDAAGSQRTMIADSVVLILCIIGQVDQAIEKVVKLTVIEGAVLLSMSDRVKAKRTASRSNRRIELKRLQSQIRLYILSLHSSPLRKNYTF